jgi:hypothetical protein
MTMLVLCLVAALSGTPLRQAEAAGDLARALGELEQGQVIEIVDGGVGDDTNVSILKAGAIASRQASALLMPADPLPALRKTPALAAQNDHGLRAERRAWLTADPGTSCAWLQRFLF